MQLQSLKPRYPQKRKKRRGCGEASGHGKTSCRGNKGENSRTGSKLYLGFQGGMVPLMRKLPKRGFNPYKKNTQIVSLELIEKECAAGEKITPELLKAKGLIRRSELPVKILSEGTLSKALTFAQVRCSEKAKQKIVSAGGAVLDQ